jgi:hypothetical protein
MNKFLLTSIVVVLLLFVLIQLLPIGQITNNPPVVKEPQWDSPETRALVVNHCYDCHSNETVWPWYSRIAPARWLVAIDVEEGRRELNFSDWEHFSQPLDEMLEQVQRGEMPPSKYTIIHANAAFDETTRQIFIEALQRSFK